MNRLLLSILVGILSVASYAQSTSIETVSVKVLKPTGSLSTCAYMPGDQEMSFYKKLSKSETSTGSFLKPYKLQGKLNKFVSWYGVVRGVKTVADKPDTYDLLLEHKYFDGMTDCHIMLVSESGGGDFIARVSSKDGAIPSLGLVRVYGKVMAEPRGVPQIEAEYVRVWPWFTFTLTDLGAEDHSNSTWKKVCKPCQGQGRIYNPYPTEDYYLAVLGDPKDYGTRLPSNEWPR